ncbi:MAG: hypothetical protein BWZ01_01344 [Deltaproteobacteria bacterium ADurb.BinA179]|nr:MAG: hypothetical protein BWZ01_01344 [Deltaproteobacteria bacterium ADurb.BinA179]
MITRTPAVRMGKPFDDMDSRFTEHRQGGITILVSKDVIPDRPDGVISIGLRKFLLSREITVSGARSTVSEA